MHLHEETTQPMKTYVALLRGVNVGGRNKLLMEDLVNLLENAGSQEVKTYIQSGNAVFRNPTDNPAELSSKVGIGIKQTRGFEPRVLLLEAEDLRQAIITNPFTDAEDDPANLHVYFLEFTPQAPDLAGLDALRSEGERIALKGKCFYLHAPSGAGKSKLAARAERLLGVPTTARNWKTVNKLMDMAEQMK